MSYIKKLKIIDCQNLNDYFLDDDVDINIASQFAQSYTKEHCIQQITQRISAHSNTNDLINSRLDNKPIPLVLRKRYMYESMQGNGTQ